MRYRELPLPGALARHVESLWTLEDEHAAAARPPRAIYPDGHVELVFNLGDPTAELREGEPPLRQDTALLAGQLERPVRVVAGMRLSLLGVRFRPEAAGALAGEPPAGCVLSLEEAAGAWGRALAARLGSAPGEAPELLAEALRARLARAPAAPLSLREAVRTIAAAGGSVPMDAVARRSGVSSRELQRGFARWVGVSPKRFARIVRFQAVLNADDAGWAETAVACGYYDQAHLIRDFRELAGAVPTRVRAGFDGLSEAFARRASHSSKTGRRAAASLWA